MSSVVQVVVARDSTVSTGDNRQTGLTPSWVFLKKMSDDSDITQPSISEVAQGQYKFSYDAESLGEAAGQIDMGSSLTNPSDRYIDVILTRDSGRIQTALPNASPAASGGLATVDANNKVAGIAATVSIDLTQAIPTSNTSQTVGDALNAARAQGFGKWTLSGTTLRLFGPDGTTVVRTFTLDSSSTPTQRL
jgi:hypothetical protein